MNGFRLFSLLCSKVKAVTVFGVLLVALGVLFNFTSVGASGTWNSAAPVPGLAALNTGGGATVNSVSCSSDGNCVGGGFYLTGSGSQGFVATLTSGTWSSAIPVPGLVALNTSGDADVVSVSCSSDGNCAIGGSYNNGSGSQGFVADLVTPHLNPSTTSTTGADNSTTGADNHLVAPAFAG